VPLASSKLIFNLNFTKHSAMLEMTISTKMKKQIRPDRLSVSRPVQTHAMVSCRWGLLSAADY